MRLYLVRHGEAVSDFVDSRRPLSEKGKGDVQKIAQFLKSVNVKVDTIVHSGKRRAEETAAAFQNTLNPSAKLLPQDYLSPNDPIDYIVKDISRCKDDLMVVGHLPFLANLVSQLVSNQEDKIIIELKTSSVVALERDTSQIWRIIWFVTPDLLK